MLVNTRSLNHGGGPTISSAPLIAWLKNLITKYWRVVFQHIYNIVSTLWWTKYAAETLFQILPTT